MKIEAEDYAALYDEDSVYSPAVTDGTVQIWEKSSAEYIINTEEEMTYAVTLNLSTEVAYITGGNQTAVNVYLNDELVNERVEINGDVDGNENYTLFTDNSLGYITLASGENRLKIEVPNDWGARNIIMDYFTLAPAEMVTCPAVIQAEDFQFYQYTKDIVKKVADIKDLSPGDKLTNGTGDGIDGVNAVNIPAGAYTSYSFAVPEAGYYKISLSASVQGNRTGSGNPVFAWCDNRLVPNIRVNGVDAYSPSESYAKKVHTLRASGDGSLGMNEFGPYFENEKITIYLNKGGNSLDIGFIDGYSSAYCNQPYRFDCFNLSYIGAEPDPEDKPNVQQVPSGETTSFSPKLYDYNESIDVENKNFSQNGDILTLRKGSTLVYNVKTDGGLFKLTSQMLLADRSVSGYINVSVNKAGYASAKITGTADSWGSGEYAPESWGILELSKGVNTISIQTDTDLMFKQLTFSPAGEELSDPIWSAIRVEARDAYDYYVDSTFDEEHSTGTVRPKDGLDIVKDGSLSVRRRDYYKYTITAPKAGNYNFSLSAALGDRAYAPIYYKLNGAKPVTGFQFLNTGTWTDYVLQSICVLHLEEGENDFEYGIDSTSTNFGIYVQNLQFACIDDFSLLGSRANNRQLDGSEKVFRGTDTLKFFFNGNVDAATVNSSTVSLTAEDGGRIPAKAEVDGNVINLKLLQSLDYSTGYQVYLSKAITSNFSVAGQSDYNISFKTIDEGEEDNANDVIESAQMDITYEDVKVIGSVRSANGLTMGGRKMYATLCDPDGNIVTSDIEGVTDAEGKYTLSYTMAQNSKEGEYTISVTDEYCDTPAVDSALYFALETESGFLTALNSAKNSDEVKAVLENYEARLGYDLENDLSMVPDVAKFYADFVGRNYQRYIEFAEDYDFFRYAEAVKQLVDNTKLEPVLFNEETCGVLGVPYEDILLIQNNRNLFLAELIRNRNIEDPYEYAKMLKELVNTYLSIEYDVAAPALTGEDKSVYVGQGVSVDAAFVSVQNNVKAATIKIEDITGNTNLLEAAAVKPAQDVTVVKEGRAVTLEYSPNTPGTAASLGSITITAGTAGAYKLKLFGEIQYSVSDNAYVALPLEEKTVTITVNAGTGGSTSGGNRPSGGKAQGDSPSSGNPGVPATPATPSEPYRFTDLSGVGWAQSSIYMLLADSRGIISESEDYLFRPNDFVKREEFAKMIVLMKGAYSEISRTNFADVDSDAWYYSYVASAEKSGLILGYDDGCFGIGQNMTRQDMTVILARCLGDRLSEPDYSQSFADDEEMADYAKESIYKIKTAGLVEGVGNNCFAPRDMVTRAMAAKVICEALSIL